MSGFLHILDSSTWLALGITLCVLSVVVLIVVLSSQKQADKLASLRRQKKSAGGGITVRAYADMAIGSRKSQQDYVIIPDMRKQLSNVANKGMLCIVCDGMGGMNGGERASSCCAELLFQGYYNSEYPSPEAFYSNEIARADKAVAQLEDENGSSLRGGTTLVSTLVLHNRLYFASVGDSRIYLYRENALAMLTRDHNYMLTLQEKVKNNEMDAKDALAHPQKEALTSYIGMDGLELVDVERDGIPICAKDIVLLCSDGLTKALGDEEIASVLNGHTGSPAELPRKLIDAALGKNWIRHDNITVAIVSCVG